MSLRSICCTKNEKGRKKEGVARRQAVKLEELSGWEGGGII